VDATEGRSWCAESGDAGDFAATFECSVDGCDDEGEETDRDCGERTDGDEGFVDGDDGCGSGVVRPVVQNDPGYWLTSVAAACWASKVSPL
jgi:hypothetical protein